MHPIFFHIGGLEIAAYGIFTAAGYAAAIIYLKRSMRGAGILDNNFWDFVLSLFIGAVLGGKILYVAVFHDSLGTGFFKVILNAVLSFRYGFVFYGGFIGAVAASWYFVRKHKMNFLRVTEIMMPSLALGHFFGRLGCFSAGCCWGRACDLPWAVTFTDVYSARAVGTPMDTPLHPSQLYESFAAFLIFLALLWLAPRKRFQGQVTLAYVALYSAVRFGLEFLRGDPDRGAWFGGTVSTSQLIAVALVLGVAVLLPRIRKTQAIATP